LMYMEMLLFELIGKDYECYDIIAPPINIWFCDVWALSRSSQGLLSRFWWGGIELPRDSPPYDIQSWRETRGNENSFVGGRSQTPWKCVDQKPKYLLILVPHSFKPITTRMSALKIADHESGSLPPADIWLFWGPTWGEDNWWVVGPLLISTMTYSCTVDDSWSSIEFLSLTLSGELLLLRSKITKR
jgi:hypothetical protein